MTLEGLRTHPLFELVILCRVEIPRIPPFRGWKGHIRAEFIYLCVTSSTNSAHHHTTRFIMAQLSLHYQNFSELREGRSREEKSRTSTIFLYLQHFSFYFSSAKYLLLFILINSATSYQCVTLSSEEWHLRTRFPHFGRCCAAVALGLVWFWTCDFSELVVHSSEHDVSNYSPSSNSLITARFDVTPLLSLSLLSSYLPPSSHSTFDGIACRVGNCGRFTLLGSTRPLSNWLRKGDLHLSKGGQRL